LNFKKLKSLELIMKKTDLVKLITKKAGISDSSAKEFFDVFLRKIAEELELG